MEKWKFLPYRDSNSDPPVIQAAASRYIDGAISALMTLYMGQKKSECQDTTKVFHFIWLHDMNHKTMWLLGMMGLQGHERYEGGGADKSLAL
jgi:hypothetical protein